MHAARELGHPTAPVCRCVGDVQQWRHHRVDRVRRSISGQDLLAGLRDDTRLYLLQRTRHGQHPLLHSGTSLRDPVESNEQERAWEQICCFFMLQCLHFSLDEVECSGWWRRNQIVPGLVKPFICSWFTIFFFENLYCSFLLSKGVRLSNFWRKILLFYYVCFLFVSTLGQFRSYKF